MSKLPPFMIKRMVFIFCVMFPVMLYAEYTGNNSFILAGLSGGVSSGASVILFPSDEQRKKNQQQDKQE